MAIMKSNDGKDLAVSCDCGCDEGFRIRISELDEESFSILTYTSGRFYTEQNHTVFGAIGKKFKKIWRIFRNKDYCYSEIVMSRKDFKEFKDYINSIGENPNE
jgi:hypothetical protein